MHKIFAIAKGIFLGRVRVDRLEKTSISKTPGAVTDVAHN